LNSPRRPEDPDGPQERHLILLDNGRKAVQASGLCEILYCIRCGACLNACPVFREIGGHAYVSKSGKGSPYPGPIGSVISPALFGQLEYGHLARASSLCAACREACPVDIDLPKLLLRVRAGIQANQTITHTKPNPPVALAFGLGLFTLAASSPRRFTVVQWLAGLFGSLVTLVSKGEPWMRLPRFSGWGYSKDFPSPPRKSFRSRYPVMGQTIRDRNDSGTHANELPASGPTPADREGVSTPQPLLDFAAELEKLGGKFISCALDEAPHEILEILHNHSTHEILAWDASLLPDKLLEKLSQAGIHICHPTGTNLETSSQIKAGLTGVTAAIVDTGSLLLLGGPGRPFSASLLPEIHIAVVRESDIYANLNQVLQLAAVKQAPAAILITGPSRTADIEMTLTIGVHGPGELYVICINNG
jgi:L-lactate dehydrogenase complex protein LldF